MSILFDLEIKIETKEDALKVVKGASTVFLFTAVLAAIAASFLSIPEFNPYKIDLRFVVINIFLIIGLSVLLRATKSRIIAILLFLYTLINLTEKILLIFLVHEAPLGMWLVALRLLAAFRSIQATFLLHGKLSRR